MPAIVDQLSISKNGNPSLDRRRKLTDEQRQNIRNEYFNTAESDRPTMTSLAQKYGVDRRLIQFILFPEREKRHKQRASKRWKEGRYYDRERSRKNMQNYRDYKRRLLKEGQLHVTKHESIERGETPNVDETTISNDTQYQSYLLNKGANVT